MNWYKQLYLWYKITRASPDVPELLQARSSGWRKVRDEYLFEYPECRVCKTTKNLEVHHIRPVNYYPELELVWDNLITLCRDHHFLYGHLLNWRAWNPNVIEDVEIWNKKIEDRKMAA